MVPTVRQQQDSEIGITRREEFSSTEITRNAETAMATMAAQHKAMTEARFVVAARFRRSWDDIRVNLNNLCRNTEFAAEALYVKPVSMTPDGWENLSKRDKLIQAPDKWPTGFSIRFVEAAIFEAGNIDVDTIVVWEDDEKRMTRVGVLDLQTNNGYWRTITTRKIVERRSLKKGQESLGTRLNSRGDIVYLIEATEAEVTQLEASAISKTIRTLGEKLLPPHYKAEWKRLIWETLEKELTQDPEGTKKQIIDNFASKGITPSMIEEYLNHPISATQPAEYITLRGIYVAIAAGEATWADVTGGPPEEGQKPSPAQQRLAERIEAQRKKTAGGSPQDPAQQQQQAGRQEPGDAAQGKTQEGKNDGPRASQAQDKKESTEQPQSDAIILEFGKDNLPDAAEMKPGTRAYFDGKIIQVVEPEGEAPSWKTIGVDQRQKEQPKKPEDSKKDRKRNPEVIDFTK